MIIPFSQGYQGPQREQPDEAMMLMALAHMKQIGRIPEKGQQLAMTKPQSEQQIMAPEPKNLSAQLKREEKSEEIEQNMPQPLHGLEVYPKNISGR